MTPYCNILCIRFKFWGDHLREGISPYPDLPQFYTVPIKTNLYLELSYFVVSAFSSFSLGYPFY